MKAIDSKKTIPKKSDIDKQTLKMWKYSSTKAKLNWLESAYRFGKLKKF